MRFLTTAADSLSARRFSSFGLICALLCGTLISSAHVFAAGQLMVAPTRVVFDERERSAEVNVMNTGDEKAVYRISFVQKRMTETGEFQTIEDEVDGEKFADKMIRFSPRQVELPPGKSQTVRLLLRKPANLENGEYRSHLLFQNVPEVNAQSIETLTQESQRDIRISLTPVLGITIPVIVRHGDTSASVKLENLALGGGTKEDAGKHLSFEIRRNGNQSVYGDLTVYFTPKGGDKKVIGRANGVAVYTPNDVRKIRLVLDSDAATDLRNGTLELTFRARPDEGGAVLAEAELLLL